MSKRTGPTNPLLRDLILELKRRSSKQNANIWKRVALDLGKPSRKRRVVNLSRINRYTKENELIVVPGKVLGSGSLNHKLTIAAYQFSDSAKEKIAKVGGSIVPLLELSKEKPDGKRIRIIA